MVDEKLIATTVSSRDVGIKRRSEGTTASSHEEGTMCGDQNHKELKGEGGGRQRLKHVDADFPLFMREMDKERRFEKNTKTGRKGKAEADKNCDTTTVMFLAA